MQAPRLAEATDAFGSRAESEGGLGGAVDKLVDTITDKAVETLVEKSIDTIFDPVVEGILQPKPAAKEFERPWIEATQDVIAEHWAAFRKPPEELPTRAPRTNSRGEPGVVS
jgi:hypothetical protein